jgi:threonine dehydratase
MSTKSLQRKEPSLTKPSASVKGSSSPFFTGGLPTYADVEHAARTLAGVAHRTPVLTSSSLDEALGAKIFFKAESLQRIGAFKFRGAYNALANLSPAQKQVGVVAFSSGNHAQAVALSGRLLGIETTIIMPLDAPAAKLAATKGYGAKVVTYDRYLEKRDEIAARLAKEHGYTVIPPFNHPLVIAGQGTAGKELFEDVGPLDALLVCLGGGGLTSGCALAAQALSPGCKVYGVEPEAGNDAQQSLRAGKIIEIPPPRSIADGAVTTALGDLTFGLMQSLVEDVLTVSDEQLIQTMRWFAERMKLVVEPTGCLAAAAVMQGVFPIVSGARIGVILSGGNVDVTAYGKMLAS